jgi:hypothetical protein
MYVRNGDGDVQRGDLFNKRGEIRRCCIIEHSERERGRKSGDKG